MRADAQVNAKKYLNIIKRLYPQIKEEFEKIETDGSYSKTDVRAIRFGEIVDKTLKILKQIDTNKMRDSVDEEIIKTIDHNINFIYEDLLYIKKLLLAYEYADDLYDPIKNYLKFLTGDPYNYRKWAEDADQLTKKFIGVMTHPDNIDLYKGYFKRMTLGTMSLREFKKIFEATKHKLIPLPSHKFESFSAYNNKK